MICPQLKGFWFSEPVLIARLANFPRGDVDRLLKAEGLAVYVDTEG